MRADAHTPSPVSVRARVYTSVSMSHVVRRTEITAGAQTHERTGLGATAKQPRPLDLISQASDPEHEPSTSTPIMLVSFRLPRLLRPNQNPNLPLRTRPQPIHPAPLPPHRIASHRASLRKFVLYIRISPEFASRTRLASEEEKSLDERNHEKRVRINIARMFR